MMIVAMRTNATFEFYVGAILLISMGLAHWLGYAKQDRQSVVGGKDDS